MPVSYDDIMKALPKERRARIERRAAELLRDIEIAEALCALIERTREQISRQINIKLPSVIKMERRVDLYLSTLRRFVEAAGGTLELRVELPGKGTMHLTGIGEISDR